MFRKIFVTLVLVSYLISSSGALNALAIRFFGPPPEEQPSIFAYTYRGLGLGMLCGLSAGYLRYGVDTTDDSKNVLLSMGYGAIGGMLGGTIIGVIDLSSGQSGLGSIILRDMYYGGYLGLLCGAIFGGINAMANENTDRIGHDMAVGYLCGVVFGLGIGMLEGPQLVSNPHDNFRYNVILVRDTGNNYNPGLGISYNF